MGIHTGGMAQLPTSVLLKYIRVQVYGTDYDVLSRGFKNARRKEFPCMIYF
jgi:hypothetical protein